MYETKRKPGQVLKIGRDARLVLESLSADRAKFVMAIGTARHLFGLTPGHDSQFNIGGKPVTVLLRSIVRGEALLGIDADRTVSITREGR